MKNQALKISFSALLLICLTAMATDSFGQPRQRVKSKRVIRRTAIVVLVAHKKVKEGKVYSGDFARAVIHQRFARRLWRKRKYIRAILHSRYARRMAFAAIRVNKGTIKKEWEFDKEENISDTTSDKELEDELLKDVPDAIFKDEQFIEETLEGIDLDE